MAGAAKSPETRTFPERPGCGECMLIEKRMVKGAGACMCVDSSTLPNHWLLYDG